MKRFTGILIFTLLCSAAYTQIIFTASAKQGPVVEGESFPVEFVLESTDDKTEFQPPDFKGFDLINGPFIYPATAMNADGIKQLRNFIYTLKALKPGVFTIDAASAKVNGNAIRSNKITIEVISRAEAIKRNLAEKARAFEPNNNATLAPGEDPYDKMRKNLFVKASVNKRSCYVGEPVIATFKLYSTLESRSDIVKNPGFYGFTVQDMAGLEDNKISYETINGKRFDVHTIRVVQLYPLQAGSFTIDPMEIENKVSFFKNAVSKKPRQEIVEGIFTDGQSNDENIFENSIHTEAITIHVKPYPVKNKPVSFNGATGQFSIEAFIDKTELKKNEEANLVVTVIGKGNFTQLTEPVIQWPEGLEGFESKTTDLLDIQKVPMTGKRVFKIPFVVSKEGNYTIPAIRFSFFDPDTNNYKTVTTEEIKITVKNETAAHAVSEGSKNGSENRSYTILILTAGILVLLILMAWLVWRKKGKKESALVVEPEKTTVPSVAQILAPVASFIPVNDKGFYALLRSCIWNFFSRRFELYGSNMSRQNLLRIMNQKKIDDKIQEEIIAIIDQCETGIFTDVNSEADRTALVQRTTDVLEKIDSYFH